MPRIRTPTHDERRSRASPRLRISGCPPLGSGREPRKRVDALLMTDDSDILALEEELRQAMLAGDVATLDRLIADELLFSGPTGELATKAQDLAAYRDRVIRFLSHEPEELSVRRIGSDVALVSLRTRLAVEVNGTVHRGAYRYTRVWARERGGAWQIVGGHVSAVAPTPGAAG